MIEVNSQGYLLQREDGSQSLLLQHELQRVDLLNEDEVYFLLIGPASSLVVPQATRGTDELLVHLQKLPGFDHQAFLEAMNSPGRVTCWQREAGAVALETRPCVGTPPVTIASILELLAGAQTHGQILETHPGLTEADILAALKYAATRVG